MMDKVPPQTLESVESFRTRFAPVLALKSAAQDSSLTAKSLSETEQQQAWDALVSVVPEVLAQCSGITTQTDQKDTFLKLVFWDFFNGREICVSVNKSGGYNLSIRAEEIRAKHRDFAHQFPNGMSAKSQ